MLYRLLYLPSKWYDLLVEGKWKLTCSNDVILRVGFCLLLLGIPFCFYDLLVEINFSHLTTIKIIKVKLFYLEI